MNKYILTLYFKLQVDNQIKLQVVITIKNQIHHEHKRSKILYKQAISSISKYEQTNNPSISKTLQ